MTDPHITMDRLVSASSGEDALRSLEDLLEASVTLEVVLDHPDCLDHVLHLLQSREFKSTQRSLASSDEAEIVHVILKLYQTWAQDSQCLLQPQPGRLLEALLDVIDVTHGGGAGGTASSTILPVYVRVLALQVLHQLVQHHGKVAQDQWLQAPNGLHRLLEQLWVGTTNGSNAAPAGGAGALDEEEAVRVHALEVAHLLAKQSPAIAKIFLFEEVESQLLDVFWKIYGGLTTGHGFVADGLTLIYTCLQQQASETSLLELIWQRPVVPLRLAQLLDLRGGYTFLHPNEYQPKPKNTNKLSAEATGKMTTPAKSAKLGPLSRRNNTRSQDKDHDDDLDSLLQSAATTTTSQKNVSLNANTDVAATTTTAVPLAEHPQLLESEETVISLVLKIIDVLLEPTELRQPVWTKYAPALTAFCWELALMVPPPSGAPAYFALPSSFLQRSALQLVATKMASPQIMEKMNGLDRLLNVVCTGGGLATNLPDRMGCSQAALHVLRQILEPTKIHTLLLHTLAPPPLLDDQEDDALPPPPTVVQKLWNTVAEHLDTITIGDSGPDPDTDSRTIFVSGALGALAVFCVDAESREMLVQSTPPLASIEHMLEVLSQQQQEEEAVAEAVPTIGAPTLRQVRTYALYRFLLQYIHETPALVQALLSSPASIHLATLATSPSIFQPLTLLLLGFCLEFFPSASVECGGWTMASLLQVFQRLSIPKATKLMQGFFDNGSTCNDNKNKATGGGSFLVCELEAKYWRDWYQQALWTVRKRLVKELAGIGGGSPEEGDEQNDEVTKEASQKIKPLQTMIAQQSMELEEMRFQLDQANARMKMQASQLETWERRTQSNPTQLDGILNELTQKTATMEEEIARLESQADHTAEQYQKDLAVVREQLEEQRDEAVKLRVSSREAQEDRDRMEQELFALSQAYSSLEDEFRRSSTSQVDASMHTPSSTEVSTLRAENERLRSSAKEADEWMAQAYNKMTELGTHNASLEKEVSLLTERLNNTASQHEESLRQTVERVSEQESVLLAQVSSLQAQLQSKEIDFSSLREQLHQAVTSQEQWRKAYDGLEQAKVDLEQQIQALSSTNPDLSGRLVELEGHLETKSIEIQGLQASLDEARQSFQALATSNLTNSETLTKLEAARKEVEAVRTRSEEEIYKREATIRELENRLGAGLGAYTLNDIRSREEEIEELRAANEAAQDWMGKAVEQHRLLQEKLWAATQASNAATADEAGVILALKQAIAAEEGRHADTRRLVDALEMELLKTKAERDELRTELSLISDNSNDQLINWKNRVADLELQLSQQKVEIDTVDYLERELGATRRGNEELQTQLSMVSNKSREELIEFENRVANLELQLAGQEAKAKAAIAQWQESHAAELARGNHLEQQLESLNAQVTVTSVSPPRQEKASSPIPEAVQFFGVDASRALENVPSAAELAEELRKTEIELREVKSNLRDVEEVVRQWQDRTSELQMEIDRIQTRSQEQEEEAERAISQWQDAHTMMEKRCVELENELQIIKAEADRDASTDDGKTEDVIATLRSELDAANKALESDQEVVRQWEFRVEELEATISSLTNQIEDKQKEILEQEEAAERAISQWQDAHTEMEKRCVELENELQIIKTEADRDASTDDGKTEDVIATLRSELDAANKALESDQEVVRQWEFKVEELEATISSLTNQIEDKQKEILEQEEAAERAISQWQDAHAEMENRCVELENELQIIKTEADRDASTDDGKTEDVIATLRSELDAANKALESDQEVVRQWEFRVEELEATISSLSNQISEGQKDAADAIVEWENKCAVLEQVIEEMQGSHKTQMEATRLELENVGKESAVVVELWSDRVKELEGHVAEIQTSMAQQEADANKAIQAWESQVAQLQEELTAFRTEHTPMEGDSTVASLKRELEEERGRHKQAREDTEALKMELAETRSVVDRLTEEIEGERFGLQEARQEITVLTRSLDESRTESEMVIGQWRERVEELESQIENFQSLLSQQEKEANDAIALWENKASELEAELASLEAGNVHANKVIIEQLQEELAVNRGQHTEAREEIATLTRDLEDIREESKVVVQQWSYRVDELEGRVVELESTLSQQESDANEAISSWEKKYNELQHDLQTLEGEKNQSTESLVAVESQLAALQSRNDDLGKAEQTMQAKLDLVAMELIEVRSDRDRLKDIIASKSREKLEEERDRLTVVIAQMEEELVEANAMIQRHITNESSHRAAEGAAHALRGEIEALKREIQDITSAADDERYRRELAEEEIERLREDIAALLSLNENEHPGEDFQQRTAKAVERLKTKERIEIDQLRKALYRCIEEVESARASEKEVSERLSKLRLQTAVGEQEIISAKSEINFLAESLEELRRNEEEKRASLEYRIGFLDDENDMLRRYHSSELETVRNELAQVGMEKDRILYQLKESEKTNASLVLAASSKTDPSIDDPESIESAMVAEVARLRIENAHLLTVAADDKARSERRLREALEAYRATAEADTILEQELRIAAEASIKSLKAQLEESRSLSGRHRGDGSAARDEENTGKAEERVGMLAAELDKFRQELQKLKKENSDLKAKMLQAARRAKDEITSLTEECRLAQAKATHMVRADRYDAAVQLEVSKLRLSPEKAGMYRPIGTLEEKDDYDDPAIMHIEPTLVGAESYDLIHKQREDMEEERRMYREFLADHDDLLALLAQNDLERDHLKKALVQTAGSEVLDRVLGEVEAMTLQEYGNIIKTVS